MSNLADAINGRLPDRQKELRRRAHRWHLDPGLEQELKRRAADPAAYDAWLAAMRISGFPLAEYAQGRAAAIELKTWEPEA